MLYFCYDSVSLGIFKYFSQMRTLTQRRGVLGGLCRHLVPVSSRCHLENPFYVRET